MSRPEYIRCIGHTHAEKQKTAWCGRMLQPFEWRFVDIEHAAYNGIGEGRALPCPACVEAVVKALGGEKGKTP